MAATDPTTAPATCPECGSPLLPGMSALLCPVCLLRAPEESEEELDEAETWDETGMQFGRYRLLEELDRGGMGIVYRARQIGLGRDVALKILPGSGLMTQEWQRLFKQEAASAAGLNHPHVVKIIEAGEHRGQLFIAMELVEGESLASRLKERPLDPTLAAQLMRQIADAVAHTHAHGVVHRDLKPANIIITAEGAAVLVDFGLAKEAAGAAGESRISMGSPHYMPPERLEGGRAPDAASQTAWAKAGDIYGLGAVLYHCLTGLPPHTGDSVAEVLGTMLEREPVRPRLLRVLVPRDLETICLKCLERRPESRYGSAAEVRDDLDRFLRDEPTVARPVGAVERLWRWCRRHVALSLMVLGLVLAITLGTSISLLGWRSAARQTRLTLRANEALRQQSYISDVASAGAAMEAGSIALAEQLLERQVPAPGAADLRGIEWFYLRQQLRPQHAARVEAQRHIVTGMEWSPDGSRLASISQDGSLLMMDWDSTRKTLTPVPTKLAPCRERCCSLAWLPDGQNFMVSSYESGVSMRRASDGAVLWQVPGRSFSLSQDARRIAISTAKVFSYHEPGQVRIYRLEGEIPPTLERELTGAYRLVALSGNGRWLATSSAADVPSTEHYLDLYDLNNPDAAPQTLPLPSPAQALCIHPAGDELAVSMTDSSKGILRFSLPSGSPLPTSFAPKKNVWSLRYRRDGSGIVAGSSDRSVFAVSLPGGKITRLPLAHRNEVWCVALHPTEAWLASGDKDGEILLHPFPLRPPQRRSYPTRPFSKLVFTPDSQALYTETDAAMDPQVGETMVYQRPVRDDSPNSSVPGKSPLGCTPDGSRVEWHDTENQFYIRAASPHGKDRVLKVDFPPADERHGVRHTRMSRNGRFFALIFYSGLALHLDLATDQITLLSDIFPRGANGLTVSEDGRYVVSGDLQVLCIHDRLTRQTRRLANDRQWAQSVDFSPDGRYLATAGISGRIEILRVPDFQLVTVLQGHLEEATFVKFSPDGRTLISSENGEGLRFWSTTEWRELLHLKVPDVYQFSIAPDGQAIAVEIIPGRDREGQTRVEILEMGRSAE